LLVWARVHVLTLMFMTYKATIDGHAIIVTLFLLTLLMIR